MNPLVSIVIPTYNRPTLLSRCLQALTRQRVDLSRVEVLVVDDGNDAETRRTVAEFALESPAHFRYVPQPVRSGPAAARNRGWQLALGPFIGFTDDDCLPEPDWVATGLAALDAGADVVSGRVNMPLPARPTDYERTTALLETAEFVTANCFCRRAALEAVGGLDERFDIAWREDSDLQFRLLERGFSVQKNPNLVVVHPLRPAPWWAPLRDERKNRYDALLYKQHPRLFRERIPAYAGLVAVYYGIVVSFVVALSAAFTRQMPLLQLASVVWAALTAGLVVWRLRGGIASAGQVGQTVATGLLAPFLSVYWRLYGAVKYRVAYF
jgi:glycosyltransferase involved in cell wall biosynthesis